jgi:hypothetical protein
VLATLGATAGIVGLVRGRGSSKKVSPTPVRQDFGASSRYVLFVLMFHGLKADGHCLFSEEEDL